jgi:hypothetical protein
VESTGGARGSFFRKRSQPGPFQAYRRNFDFYDSAELEANPLRGNEFSGATRRSRTGDLLITNQPLYQLS